ncbi:hypothetical protein NNRS527_03149 (plasmid) [Nitrosospira sp. NRS527]|nr:hypothetical protein NNRS527_03149 [Nitrosospira sp. NRS527]
MPRYPESSYTLSNTESLLMSDVSGTSFDSRYFGPVQAFQIQSVIRTSFNLVNQVVERAGSARSRLESDALALFSPGISPIWD